jgi:hypothetical protein
MKTKTNKISNASRELVNGQPHSTWDIFGANGTIIGWIEAHSDGEMIGSSREWRWWFEGYTVQFCDGDFEIYFAAKDYGGARKALTAAKNFSRSPITV